MPENRLNIVSTENTENKPESRFTKRQKMQSKYEKLWEEDPNRFDPDRDAMERERVVRTWHLMQEVLPAQIKHSADLGCGYAPFSLRLIPRCEKIHAVDIAKQPLERLKNSGIETHQDYVPQTKLNDDFYDLVIATELVALLPKEEFRLFMAELARLVNLKGHVVCSTPIDIYSEDALQVFVDLFETEFKLEKWSVSHHSYYIRLCHLLNLPYAFVKAQKDAQYRASELNKRFSIGRFWFKWNSTWIPSLFWRLISLLTRPLYRFVKQSTFWLIQLEKLCRTFSPESGVSHAIFIGRRRPLFEDLPKDKQPITRKSKREVWE